MKNVLKEPFVHFLLIGGLLFFLYGLLNTERDESEIFIDDNLVNELVAKWESKRNRQPTFEELENLIEEYIRQEVLYKEALVMKLDHNDEIVKRRLAQKMEFISDGLTETLQPTKEMLMAYYEKNKSNYKRDPSYTFRQVYFSADERNNALADATNALVSRSPETLGDDLLLPGEYTDASSYRIANDLGSAFAQRLASLEVGRWTGPITSSYGVHIVFIKERREGGYFTFEEVVEKVTVDYNFDASNDFKEELISSLLKNYTVVIDVADVDLKNELNEKF
jgi:parvulin-like peptidyl-prolyl isomerase